MYPYIDRRWSELSHSAISVPYGTPLRGFDLVLARNFPQSHKFIFQQKSRPVSGRLQEVYVRSTSEAEPFWAIIIGQTNTLERPIALLGSCEPMLFCRSDFHLTAYTYTTTDKNVKSFSIFSSTLFLSCFSKVPSRTLGQKCFILHEASFSTCLSVTFLTFNA